MKLITDIFNHGEVIEESPGRLRFCNCVLKVEFGGRRPNEQCENIIVDFQNAKMYIYSCGHYHTEFDIKLVPIMKRGSSGKQEEATTWDPWEQLKC